ncbi:hypothetical protein RO3G_08482 [Lichtheimia corymbifera JMRC:FSU:9682]|uniref:C2H2-type domain-containing protein n=2 Tax=Lichtheimia TaxID=688353 RepID=A0A068S9U8_9FUNG|nr:uncharacterized protein O0I10_000178 [Lichtheimia ornata]KAJ8663903.1 hypothetical protein O0I10_000178 [Lichtheimia ornata]CDH59064.1 hypothetical protein RO3G_08482 [Lichtheimia corymbifera JMRC:FSU:9682]
MPVPVEYNSVRRMSIITVPNQDINFDAYDFQLCAPQSDVKDAFESRELEASFCRDFSCCGLVLSDLHDLLQHYEECHVRLEEDESSLYDDDSSSFWSPASSVPSSPTLDDDSTDALKKKAAAYLSDLYNSNSTTLSPLTLACPTKEDDVAGNFDSIATPPLTPSTPTAPSSASSASSVVSDEAPLPITANNNTSAAKKTAGKKRTYQQYASSSTPTALDILTQSAAKKLAMAANGELPAPILTDEDFLAQAGALLASANTNANADKPYKCNVPGCQKAYKNPNGLKYHNQHGHCDLITDESENIASKPYQCTIGDCGKRYKNLNGLKYHIEHSHMAALNHTLASFGSSLFAAAPAFAAAAAAAQQVDNSANPTPEASPQASPVMSAASLAAFF